MDPRRPRRFTWRSARTIMQAGVLVFLVAMVGWPEWHIKATAGAWPVRLKGTAGTVRPTPWFDWATTEDAIAASPNRSPAGNLSGPSSV